MRLDVAITKRGLAESRAKAQELISLGAVSVTGRVEKKASFNVEEADSISLAENDLQRYVSRGGLKLEGALDAFGVSPLGRVCLDVGASSGGFTDCLLQRGASLVYAVDVGVSQLHARLREDSRVVSLEKYNAKCLKKEDFAEHPTLVVMDVSFISQTLLYPALARLLREGDEMVTLVKPQFEVGRAYVGKRGIVKNQKAVSAALCRVKEAAESFGFTVLGQATSSILGGDGNTEYLFYLKRNGQQLALAEGSDLL
ncbi:MAG: TlyA family RNA methyltransferase [Clostridia bacterium]|nr:TlyA family RNA methyltransferase [Clostridia bacterium]